MVIYCPILHALKGEPLSSVLAADEALVSASAAAHYGVAWVKSDPRSVAHLGRRVSTLKPGQTKGVELGKG